jgi:hypothetical protein
MPLLAVSSRGSRLIARYADRTLERGATGRPREPDFSARAVIALVGEPVCVGFPVQYSIDCYTSSGRHLTHVERVNVRPWPVTAGHREDYIAREPTATVGPNGAAYVARLRSTAPYARTLLLFGEFVGATNGDWWVGPYVIGGAGADEAHVPARAGHVVGVQRRRSMESRCDASRARSAHVSRRHARLLALGEALAALDVPALIADPDMRKREERFTDRDHHTSAPDPLHVKSGTTRSTRARPSRGPSRAARPCADAPTPP